MSRGDYSNDYDDRPRRRDDDYDERGRDYDDRERGRDYDDRDRGRRPPYIETYLVHSILVTCFCCLLGIVAIVHAANVSSCLARGDIRGAREASNSARTWCWISFWLGLGPLLLVVVFWVIGAMIMVAQ